MTKLIVIIGITGNQGGSVASTFLQDPKWRIRGLTRDPHSNASKALSAQGVQMLQADLHDSASLQNAFKGANLVFSVTDFWKPFFDPANQARAKKQGKPIGQHAYELELEQGQNIADAVAREVHGLDDVGFIASVCAMRGRAATASTTSCGTLTARQMCFQRMCRSGIQLWRGRRVTCTRATSSRVGGTRRVDGSQRSVICGTRDS
jgi:hypothetical protein